MCEIPLSEHSIDPKEEKRNGEKMSKKRKETNKSYITYFTELITFLYVLLPGIGFITPKCVFMYSRLYSNLKKYEDITIQKNR